MSIVARVVFQNLLRASWEKQNSTVASQSPEIHGLPGPAWATERTKRTATWQLTRFQLMHRMVNSPEKLKVRSLTPLIRQSPQAIELWGLSKERQIPTLRTYHLPPQLELGRIPESGNSRTARTCLGHRTHQANSDLATDQVSTDAPHGEQPRETQGQKPHSLNPAVGGAHLAPLLRKRLSCEVSIRDARFPHWEHTTCLNHSFRVRRAFQRPNKGNKDKKGRKMWGNGRRGTDTTQREKGLHHKFAPRFLIIYWLISYCRDV